MEQPDLFLEVTLPLLVETAVALGVLALGLVAVGRGRRWGWFAVAAGALWGVVEVVYAVEWLATDIGLGMVIHENGLLTPLRYLRLLGIALLLPALGGAALGRTRTSPISPDQARSRA